MLLFLEDKILNTQETCVQHLKKLFFYKLVLGFQWQPENHLTQSDPEKSLDPNSGACTVRTYVLPTVHKFVYEYGTPSGTVPKTTTQSINFSSF